MPASAPVEVVWFKRDLRLRDHRPLVEAALRGSVMPLVVIEPSWLGAADFDPAHYTFFRACLEDLETALATLGQRLHVRVGEVLEVLEAVHATAGIRGLWAHEETGNDRTYVRDRAVIAWCRERGIPFREFAQHGVIRPLRRREGWAERWEVRMGEPEAPLPTFVHPAPAMDAGRIPLSIDLGLNPDRRTDAQIGGLRRGERALATFLASRSRGYMRGISSPLSAPMACSRLSPHLAWGTVSLRHVVQRTRARIESVRDSDTYGARNLEGFLERLHWHCHFIQKLEDDPRIEFESFVRAYDDLRPTLDRDRLEAWQTGMTGYPLVDACMRALDRTGWINFRMRAMLMSFASHHLWLPWREPALHLARRFVDYEPGIHYPQVQMQAGTTGNPTVRTYNPMLQAREQDPEGVFIRRWVPELAGVPDAYLAAPWQMPPMVQIDSGCRIGQHYPAPIVDHETAIRQARSAIGALRRDPEVQTETRRILDRHGSRRRGLKAAETRRRRQTPSSPPEAAPPAAPQLRFDFEGPGT
ncbi:MAG: deoxyribodipyrimidine photo-lyase/cryptochrome family protein [bacterium]|nr:deoxyribodipyrimidine photo-lyase/cryptochrome family protein [bacterium]